MLAHAFVQLAQQYGTRRVLLWLLVSGVAFCIAVFVLAFLGRMLIAVFKSSARHTAGLFSMVTPWLSHVRVKPGVSSLPAVIAILLLLFATILHLSWGFYTFLRLAVTLAALYYGIMNKDKPTLFWLMLCIGIAYNPLIPVRLSRHEWHFVNPLVAVCFSVCFFGAVSYRIAAAFPVHRQDQYQ